eukprot:CCRYP_008409-RB/>CCRYP_008409-RB protein AED:0.05 eAED:0.05 QI:125/1/1/1/1/1/5/1622/638
MISRPRKNHQVFILPNSPISFAAMRFREYSSRNYEHNEERIGASRRPPHMRQEPFRDYLLIHASSPNANGEDGATSLDSDLKKELKEPSDLELVWSISNNGRPCNHQSTRREKKSDDEKDMLARTIRRTGEKVKQVCCDLFLPIGYPHTVAGGYLEYQCYDSIQGLCSYLRGVVSTGAVLMAAGVGDAEATAMSAAMTWAIRDGLGMIGGLLFSYVASPYFDAHVKEFRLLADILNDVGLTLDMALPVLMTWEFPWLCSFLSPYLVLTSVSTLCKVACGISAGATKGNITDHFSIAGNRADVNAKESTQETLVSLIGMGLGVCLTKFLHSLEELSEVRKDTSTCTNYQNGEEQNETCQNFNQQRNIMTVETLSWTIFLLLTFVHVWANYVGVQRLRLRTLNRERATVALRKLAEECGRWILTHKEESKSDPSGSQESEMNELAQKCINTLPSPEHVSESLWGSIIGMFYEGNIRLGIRVKDLVRMSSTKSHGHKMASKWSQEQWDILRDEFHSERYMIAIDTTTFGIRKRNLQPTISVMMRIGATEHDEFKAFLHAHIVMWCMEQEFAKTTNEISWKQLHMIAIHRSRNIVNHFFSGEANNPHFLINVLAHKGWDVSRLYLGFSQWKCDWDFGHVRED